MEHYLIKVVSLGVRWSILGYTLTFLFGSAGAAPAGAGIGFLTGMAIATFWEVTRD